MQTAFNEKGLARESEAQSEVRTLAVGGAGHSLR